MVPGLSRTIVEQWTSETAHRRETITALRQTDHDAMENYFASERRGQFIGLTISVGFLLIAALAVVLDRPIIGAAAFIAGAAGVVWAARRRPEGPAPESSPRELDDGDDVEDPSK